MQFPKLPIHDISEKEFYEFKKKHLDKSVLDEETIKKIEHLFRGGSEAVASISCNEYHDHSYKCVHYESPEVAIVDRLISELGYYKHIINKVNEDTKLED